MTRQKSKWIGPLLLLGLVTWSGCRRVSSATLPISAGNLVDEYKKSRAAMRSKYDGTEITVSGTALTVPTMPRDGDDQGSVLLEEKDLEPRVACWFSRSQSERFSEVKGGQLITVRGVFNGESGVDLKFCKLVKTE